LLQQGQNERALRTRSGPGTTRHILTVTSKNVVGMGVVVDTHDVDLCLTDPGFEVDVMLDADLQSLTQVWMGDDRFVDALADGRITLTGPREVTRHIPDWFGQHPILADVERG
jgi:hypothetical protein